MSTASKGNVLEFPQIVDKAAHSCRVARDAADALTSLVRSNSAPALESVRQLEEELDTLDREINEGVTAAVSHVPAARGRELLACLKVVIEVERIGDLLLSFANRFSNCSERLNDQDIKDLGTMAALLERMLGDATQAFERRDTDRAVAVLRADTELDRLRNLILLRHVENPEGAPRQESFHVVFMAQSIERAGDHAKNVAEEVVHLVTGRSIRHLLRSNDKPIENMFVDYMRKKGTARKK